MTIKSFFFILFTTLATNIQINVKCEDVTSQVFPFSQNNQNIFPVAFGDYNSDKFTDLVYLSNDSTTFNVMFGSNSPPFMYHKASFVPCHLHYAMPSHPNYAVKIIGVHLADFTGDSIADILVSFQVQISSSHSTTLTKSTFVQVFQGSLHGSFDCNVPGTGLKLNGSSEYLQLKDEPLIVDINSDTIADLFGEGMDGVKYFWIFRPNEVPEQCSLRCEDCDPVKFSLPFPTPHSNSFVDLNGDFSPELNLIVLNKNTGGEPPEHYLFTLSLLSINYYDHVVTMKPASASQSMITLSKVWRLGNPIALDIALNGQLCLLIPICTNQACNKQSSHFLLIDLQSGQRLLELRLADDSGTSYGFLTTTVDSIYGSSINFYVGDYNLDGYPDLIGTLLQNGISESQAKKRPILFKNSPAATGAGHGSSSRIFIPDFNFLQEYSDTTSAFFFDLQEDGLLDIMMVGKEPINSPLDPKSLNRMNEMISVYKNIPEYDAYFVKWIVTTSGCEPSRGKACPLYSTVRSPGASMSYSTTSLENKLTSSRAAQHFRSHFALDFPYIVMGTGTSSNFIETVKFGLSNSISYTKTQIIPNSILIAIPPPSSSSTSSSSGWEVKQLINPSVEYAVKSFRGLLGIFLLLGTTVCTLWIRERRQDKLYDAQQRNKPLSLNGIAFA